MTDENETKTAAPATAAPAAQASSDIPWIGNLFGGLNFFGTGSPPEKPAELAPAPEAKAATPIAAASSPAPASTKGARPVVVNVYGAKVGKKKAKAAEGEKK